MGNGVKTNALLAVLLLVTIALAGCTGSDSTDTDGDGIPDAIEERGYESYILLMDRSVVTTYTSDPNLVDTDGDGLSDWDEVSLRGAAGLPILDPRNVDTDGDGLTDCQEWYVQVGPNGCPVPEGFREYNVESYRTEAHAMDSDIVGGPSRYINYVLNDGEGYNDEEVGADTSGTLFTRGDGLSDFQEIFGYDVVRLDGSRLTGVTSDPFHVDSDLDGLEDGEEALRYGSNPNVVDTDGDGCDDARDIFPAMPDRFRVELNEATLDASANLIFVTAIAVSTVDDFRYQPASGHIETSAGQPVDLAPYNVEPFGRSDCGPDANPLERVASATNPWLVVQAVAYDKQSGAASDNRQAYEQQAIRGLDLVSQSLPEDAFADGRVYWNPQEDVYRWSLPDSPNNWRLVDDPEAFSLDGGWLEFEGGDGSLAFRGQVVFND